MNSKLRTLSDADIKLLNEIIKNVSKQRVNEQLKQREQDTHQAPEVYVAKPVSSISALTRATGTATADTAGVGNCTLCQIDPNSGQITAISNDVQVYNLSTTAIASDWIPVFRDKFGRWLSTASNVVAGGSSAATGCGCCDCFNCISDSQAVVGGCLAAPFGAAYQYTIDLGISSNYPLLYGNQTFTVNYPINCAGTHNYSYGTDSGCRWFTCPFTLTQVIDFGTAAPSVGTYWWVLDMTLATPTITLQFISGVNFLGA